MSFSDFEVEELLPESFVPEVVPEEDVLPEDVVPLEAVPEVVPEVLPETADDELEADDEPPSLLSEISSAIVAFFEFTTRVLLQVSYPSATTVSE